MGAGTFDSTKQLRLDLAIYMEGAKSKPANPIANQTDKQTNLPSTFHTDS